MELQQYLNFDFLIRFLEGLQKFLGDKCEIVIHDYRNGYDHSIVYAFNSELSGREVGGPPQSGMITQFGKDIEPLKDSIVSFAAGQKDQFYKKCTTLISDENNKIVGSVCLNLDISGFLLAQNAIQGLIQYPPQEPAGPLPDNDSILTKNVDEILAHYIRQAETMAGKPMALMSKEEKIRALDFLDQKGVFKISKTSVQLCESFQISKYTLYNYLEEARSGRDADSK